MLQWQHTLMPCRPSSHPQCPPPKNTQQCASPQQSTCPRAPPVPRSLGVHTQGAPAAHLRLDASMKRRCTCCTVVASCSALPKPPPPPPPLPSSLSPPSPCPAASPCRPWRSQESPQGRGPLPAPLAPPRGACERWARGAVPASASLLGAVRGARCGEPSSAASACAGRQVRERADAGQQAGPATHAGIRTASASPHVDWHRSSMRRRHASQCAAPAAAWPTHHCLQATPVAALWALQHARQRSALPARMDVGMSAASHCRDEHHGALTTPIQTQ